MNNVLFGLIGFLMLGIAGIGFAEVKTQMHAAEVASSGQDEDSSAASVQAGAAATPVAQTRGTAKETQRDIPMDTVPEVLSNVATRVEMAIFDRWDDEDGDREDEDEDDNRASSKTATLGAGGNTNASVGTNANANTNTGTNTNTNTSAGVATFTMAQVAQHGSAASCYSAIGGSVYDLTPFVTKHPGGQSAIKSLCGVDGTAAFSAQHGGQGKPESVLAQYKVGILAN